MESAVETPASLRFITPRSFTHRRRVRASVWPVCSGLRSLHGRLSTTKPAAASSPAHRAPPVAAPAVRRPRAPETAAALARAAAPWVRRGALAAGDTSGVAGSIGSTRPEWPVRGGNRPGGHERRRRLHGGRWRGVHRHRRHRRFRGGRFPPMPISLRRPRQHRQAADRSHPPARHVHLGLDRVDGNFRPERRLQRHQAGRRAGQERFPLSSHTSSPSRRGGIRAFRTAT